MGEGNNKSKACPALGRTGRGKKNAKQSQLKRQNTEYRRQETEEK